MAATKLETVDIKKEGSTPSSSDVAVIKASLDENVATIQNAMSEASKASEDSVEALTAAIDPLDEKMSKPLNLLAEQQRAIVECFRKQSEAVSAFAKEITRLLLEQKEKSSKTIGVAKSSAVKSTTTKPAPATVKPPPPKVEDYSKSKYYGAIFLATIDKNALSVGFECELKIGNLVFKSLLSAYVFMMGMIIKDRVLAAKALATPAIEVGTLLAAQSAVKETEEWAKIKENVMMALLQLKTLQCDVFMPVLLESDFVKSPVLYMNRDPYWGTNDTKLNILKNEKFAGKNRYGLLIAEFQDKLKSESLPDLPSLTEHCCPEIEIDNDTKFVLIGDEQMKMFTGKGHTTVISEPGLTFSENKNEQKTVKWIVDNKIDGPQQNVKRLIIGAGGHELGREPHSVVKEFEKLCKYLSEKFEEAEIFFIGVPPRSDLSSEKVKTFNENLRRVTRKVAGVFFIDLSQLNNLAGPKLANFLGSNKWTLTQKGMQLYLQSLLSELPFLRVDLPGEIESPKLATAISSVTSSSSGTKRPTGATYAVKRDFKPSTTRPSFAAGKRPFNDDSRSTPAKRPYRGGGAVSDDRRFNNGYGAPPPSDGYAVSRGGYQPTAYSNFPNQVPIGRQQQQVVYSSVPMVDSRMVNGGMYSNTTIPSQFTPIDNNPILNPYGSGGRPPMYGGGTAGYR